MSDYLLREANTLDIEKIYKIDSSEKDSYSLDMITSMVNSENSLTMVVEIADEIAGYINYSIAIDEAELIKIVVSDAYRRQGFATKLLLSSQSILKDKGIKIVFLEVRVDNAPAISLYEKIGYAHYYTREKYYNGIDAYLYRLKLNEK